MFTIKKKKSYVCNRDSEMAELLKSFSKKEWVGDYLFPGFFENFFLLNNRKKEKSM